MGPRRACRAFPAGTTAPVAAAEPLPDASILFCLCLRSSESMSMSMGHGQPRGSHDCPCEAGSVSLDGGVVEEGQSQLSRRRSLRHEADVCSRVFTWARRRRRGLRVRALGRSSELRSASCSVRRPAVSVCLRIVRCGCRAAMLGNEIRESNDVRQRDDCKRRSAADVEER